MNHFKPKSLAFYGVAIASVLILFKTVTFLGQKNLQAPPLINKNYQLNLAQKLPNCPKTKTLKLNIQQSGIYLNAILLPKLPQTNLHQQFNLNGILQNKNLYLSGKIYDSNFCQNLHNPKKMYHKLTILMSLAKKDKISGKLTLDNSSPVEFTAQPIPNQARSSYINNH